MSACKSHSNFYGCCFPIVNNLNLQVCSHSKTTSFFLEYYKRMVNIDIFESSMEGKEAKYHAAIKLLKTTFKNSAD